MSKGIVPIIAATLLALLSSSPVAAQGGMRTIEMTVPVKLTNFGGREAWVWCELRDGSNRGVAASFVMIPVVNGTADRTVKVGISIIPAQEGLIAGWRCVVTAPSPGPGSDPGGKSGGSATPKYAAIPNLQTFGEITGKF